MQQSPDEVNNRRVGQLIEQFNAEEAYEAELREIMQVWDDLVASRANLEQLLAAFAKIRRTLPQPPPVNAIGSWIEIPAQ